MLQTKYFSLYVFHKPFARFTVDRNGVISVSNLSETPSGNRLSRYAPGVPAAATQAEQ